MEAENSRLKKPTTSNLHFMFRVNRFAEIKSIKSGLTHVITIDQWHNMLNTLTFPEKERDEYLVGSAVFKTVVGK